MTEQGNRIPSIVRKKKVPWHENPQTLQSRLNMVNDALNDVFNCITSEEATLPERALQFGIRYAHIRYEEMTYKKHFATLQKGYPGAFESSIDEAVRALKAVENGHYFVLKHYLATAGNERIERAEEMIRENPERARVKKLITRGNLLLDLSERIPLHGRPIVELPLPVWLDPTYNPQLAVEDEA